MSHSVIAPWMSFVLNNPLRRMGQDPRRILEPYLAEGMVAADIGCGVGYFTAAMADLVGKTGKVLAIDLQEAMLRKARESVRRTGFAGRVEFCQCLPDSLGLTTPLDFALAFAVIHEMPDSAKALREISAAMKPGARFLLSEPRLHVSAVAFEATVRLAETAGLTPVEDLAIRMGRSVLLRKE